MSAHICIYGGIHLWCRTDAPSCSRSRQNKGNVCEGGLAEEGGWGWRVRHGHIPVRSGGVGEIDERLIRHERKQGRVRKRDNPPGNILYGARRKLRRNLRRML
eukprot:XP_001704701.1 Hypothetical protein GL50803_31896 [Giardia lamblia ATCC 50803]